MPLARAHSIEEVPRERVESIQLLRVLKRVVRLESLETCLHLNLGHCEPPDRETGEEQVPVFGRHETGRSSYRQSKISKPLERGEGRKTNQYFHL